MRKIIFIGTLHGGITSKHELKELLERYSPNQVLVEVTEEDLDMNKLESYPEEMQFAVGWARDNRIKVNGFDSSIEVTKGGFTDEDNKKLMKNQIELLSEKNRDWKDLNKPENLEMLDNDARTSLEPFVDFEKELEREHEMLFNINKKAIKEGVIVVITGAGHLNFFEKNFSDAEFPLRK